MIEESGRVVAVEGDFAWIETVRKSACGGCAVRKGCGTSAIAKMFGQRRMQLQVLNRIHARVGDTVVVGISESGLVRGSLAVYAAPLVGLFAGALAGHLAAQWLLVSGSDLLAIGGGLAGFSAALFWLRRFSRTTAKNVAYQPVVLRQELSTDIN
ncbi:MAG TPA: Fis family transcriptional regulator [Gammaproteobacteria bacterium]|nr:Fis family transcriptional regulator [Gammaproteobacteria bacterium]